MPQPDDIRHILPFLRVSMINGKTVMITNPATDLVRAQNAVRAWITSVGFCYGVWLGKIVRIRRRKLPDGVLALASPCVNGSLVIGVSDSLSAAERRAAVRLSLRGARGAMPVDASDALQESG